MVDGMMMVQFGACVDINADMVIIVKNMLLQSGFSKNWTNCPISDQQAFSEIGPDLPVIDQNFVNFC